MVILTCAANGGTIYVDANATGANNGSSWGNAYIYLQDALTAAISGDNIWVTQGTYKPDHGAGVTIGDRTATFELKNGVSMYGGFPIGCSTWEQRDPNLYETILSGDLNGDDGADFANNVENSIHVSTVSWATGTTQVDGFTIKGGNVNAVDNSGGGLYNLGGGDVIVLNCKFINNYASTWGGAILLYLSDNSRFENCEFIQNKTLDNGGAIGFYQVPDATIKGCDFISNNGVRGGALTLWESSSTIIKCRFSDNSSDKGGAILCWSFGGWPENEIYSNPTIINSEFIGNKATSSDGGAIYFRGECHSKLINCSFVGNSASNDGGAIFEDPVFQSVYADLRNSSLVGNIAGGIGGGINAKMYNASNSSLKNCMVWGNKDSTGTGESAQIKQGSTPRVTVIYSCIQDSDPNDSYIPFGGAANHNIDDNPNFVRDPNDGGDGWGVGDNDDFGDLHLQHTSPCIDSADNASVPVDTADLDGDGNITEPIPYDLDGRPRIVDGDCNSTSVVDMGAYEFAYLYLGDFAGGCDVDLADFAVLASAWLTEEGQAGHNPDCDIALPSDGKIDTKDLQVFVENWLLGK
jgi:predicted outer membrane repeat protein